MKVADTAIKDAVTAAKRILSEDLDVDFAVWNKDCRNTCDPIYNDLRAICAIIFDKGENMLGWEVREYVKDTCTNIPFLLSEVKRLEAELKESADARNVLEAENMTMKIKLDPNKIEYDGHGFKAVVSDEKIEAVRRDVFKDKESHVEALQKETEALRARNVELEAKLKASDDARSALEAEIKKSPSISIRTTEPTDCTDGYFRGSDQQPNIFYDPDASKKDADVTIKSSVLTALRKENAELREFLEGSAESEGKLFDSCMERQDQIETLQSKLDKAVKALEEAREHIGEIPTEHFEEVSLLCQNIEKALADLKEKTVG